MWRLSPGGSLPGYPCPSSIAEGSRLLERVGTGDLAADELAAIRGVLIATGAVDEVEASIGRLVDESLAALETVPITPAARSALAELGRFVAWRDR